MFAETCDATGWTRDAVAHHLDVSPALLSRWCNPNDKCGPHPLAISRVARLSGDDRLARALMSAASDDDAEKASRDALIEIEEVLRKARHNRREL